MADEVSIADQAESIRRAIDRLAHDGNFPIKVLRAALDTVMAFEHLPAEHRRVIEERDDLQRTFDLRWKADQRAIKQWQEAHPGNDLVWPDRCDMVVWLLDQLDEVRKELEDGRYRAGAW